MVVAIHRIAQAVKVHVPLRNRERTREPNVWVFKSPIQVVFFLPFMCLRVSEFVCFLTNSSSAWKIEQRPQKEWKQKEMSRLCVWGGGVCVEEEDKRQGGGVTL